MQAGPPGAGAGGPEAKALEYERWAAEKLGGDLRAAEAERAEVDRDVEEYRALRRNLEGLVKHGQTELELLTELGADVYASAHVPDATRVYVNAGLGFHVHCSIPEALELCDLRIELLEGRVGDWTDKIAKIKAYIKLVLEGVRELRNL